jgi:hypothetical protein
MILRSLSGTVRSVNLHRSRPPIGELRGDSSGMEPFLRRSPSPRDQSPKLTECCPKRDPYLLSAQVFHLFSRLAPDAWRHVGDSRDDSCTATNGDLGLTSYEVDSYDH